MFTQKKFFAAVLAAAFLFVTVPGSVSAGEGEWEYTVVPYLWGAALNGEVTIGNRTAEADVSFGDILDNLDFGLQGYFEARKNRWGIFIDTTYMKLSSDVQVGPAEAELEITNWLTEFGGLYEFARMPLGAGGERTLTLDALAGGRYNHLKNEIIVPNIATVEDSSGTLDPFAGVRLNADLHRKVPLVLRGDIGGFGVGSEFAWQFLGILGYRFTPTMTLYGGYRVLDIDVEEGDRDDRMEINTSLSGPIVGFAFSF